MKTTYKIIEAHSGTSSEEIKKAKREFAKRVKVNGMTWGNFNTVIIEFIDENGIIKADYRNEIGERISDNLIIN